MKLEKENSKKVIRKNSKKVRNPWSYPAAVRSFLGHLKGTLKAHHTIESYRQDLLSLEKYLRENRRTAQFPKLNDLSLEEAEGFHGWLKKNHLRTNSRRRKIMTLRKFLTYLQKRKKISIDISKKIPVPYKLEKIPEYFLVSDLLAHIEKLSQDTDLQVRNKILLQTLTETGCLVSEVIVLQKEDFSARDGHYFVQIPGKRERVVEVTSGLYEKVQSISRPGSLFQGFNKFGVLSASLSARGVELLVKNFANISGLKNLTPRGFRHSIAIHWLKEGAPKKEVQKRLGLKSAYAFRVYDPVVSSVEVKTS